MPDLKKIWKNRRLILEGIISSVVLTDEIARVAHERDLICRENECGCYDPIGEGCETPGTQPCCSNLYGGCGCKLSWKQKSMHSECPKGYWQAELTQSEEDSLNL